MLRTTLLLGALTGIILWFGQFLGGPTGLMIAFAFAILMNFGSYWFSDKIVLAMYRARQVNEAEAPMLYRYRPQPRPAGRDADAPALYHPLRSGQRLCHWS